MAKDLDPFKVSSPRIFLVRMLIFLILCGLIVVVIHPQIWTAFKANPPLNALIIGVLLIGILLSFRQVIRLFPEVAWVNGFRLADPGIAVERPPVLLAPMAAILGDRIGRMTMSSQTMRSILNSIAIRLDEAREISRYMTGLLIFLGLLGTFWGLIETVSSVGGVINNLKVGGDAGRGVRLVARRPRRSAVRHGHLVLVVVVRSRRLAGAWLPRPADEPGAEPLPHRTRGLAGDHRARPRLTGEGGAISGGGGASEMRGAIDRLREAITSSSTGAGSNKAATNAMANLAEAIQGLVHHMRTEQQMIRDWVDSQAEQHREIRRLLELMTRERVDK